MKKLDLQVCECKIAGSHLSLAKQKTQALECKLLKITDQIYREKIDGERENFEKFYIII